MYGCYINYAFLRDCLDTLPREIRRDIDDNDSKIFTSANFINASRFSYCYSFIRKDRYLLHEKLLKDINPFIIECASDLHSKNDYKRLLFMYGLIAATSLNDYLLPRLEKIKRDNDNIEEIYNALDIYQSMKDNRNIVENPLYNYFNSIIYNDYIEDLIHYPMIRCYNFMGSKGYYTKSYKRMRTYCKHSCHGTWKKPIFIAFDALFARHKQGKKYMVYELKKIKDPEATNGIYHDALDAIWTDALNDAKAKIETLNKYLFYNDEKEFRRKLNIPETKKI